jgi:hypothetical protein
VGEEIVVVDPDRAQRIYYAIVAGTAKDAYDVALTDDESEFWDVVAREVREGNERGAVWTSPASLDRDDDVPTAGAPTVPRDPVDTPQTNADMPPTTSYSFTRELQPGQLLAYLGSGEGEPESLCIYFDHYGPIETGRAPSQWDDTTWYEHGYSRYWDRSTGEVTTSDIRPVLSLMSLGNGYWTIAVE